MNINELSNEIFAQIKDILKTHTPTTKLRELLSTTLQSLDKKALSILLYNRILTTSTLKFKDLLKLLRIEISDFINSLNENSDENCRDLIQDATKNLTELFNIEITDSNIKEEEIGESYNNFPDFDNFTAEIEPVLLNTTIKEKRQKKTIDKQILIKDYKERQAKEVLLKNKSNRCIKIPVELLNLIDEHKREEVVRRNSISATRGESFNETNYEQFSNTPFDDDFIGDDLQPQVEENNYRKLELKKEFIFQEETKYFNEFEKANAFLLILNEANKNSLKIEQPLIFDTIYCRKI